MPRRSVGEEPGRFLLGLILIVAGVGIIIYYVVLGPGTPVGGLQASGCLECASDELGGGCPSTDAVTGETVPPGQCIPYVASGAVSCPVGTGSAGRCPESTQPVCGSDGKDYTNSCLACQGKTNFFYFEGTCEGLIRSAS